MWQVLQSVTKGYYKVWQELQVIQNILQSVTGITKCDKRLLQSVAGVTKCDNYYKDRRNRLLLKELRIYNRKLFLCPPEM